MSGPIVVQHVTKSSSKQKKESETSTGVAVHLNKEGSSSGSDAELELNLKLDEVENRHSTMGKYQQNATHLNHYSVKVWVKFERKKLKMFQDSVVVAKHIMLSFFTHSNITFPLILDM